MPLLGKSSMKNLLQLHPDLQIVLMEAIKIFDFSIVCGYRGKEAQEKAVSEGKSFKHFPNSKHNNSPSLAADLCPYRNGLRWEDREAFYFLGGILKAIAYHQGIHIRLGLDWDGDNDLHDQNFYDLPHVELTLQPAGGNITEYA